MQKLIYLTIASLDSFMEDERGQFDWAAPDEEVHSFINDLIRPASTFLYGRRMYQTMCAWESIVEGPPYIVEFARIWRAAEKVVFSRSLDSVSTARTRIEREFRPDLIRSALAEGSGYAAIGGADLASAAFAAGLVDECHVFVVPYIAGSGKRTLPRHKALRLELLDEQRFGRGMVYLRYGVRVRTGTGDG